MLLEYLLHNGYYAKDWVIPVMKTGRKEGERERGKEERWKQG